MRFADRRDAGRRLAEGLEHLRDEDLVVLGIARGGVVVADEIASRLHAPLEVLVVRKLGVPFQPEHAMGAVGEDGVKILDPETIRVAQVSDLELAVVEARACVELRREVWHYRDGRAPASLVGRTAVLVDDGVATGSSARAACRVARARGARRIVLAAPVASPGWTQRLAAEADEFVTLTVPEDFVAIGHYYEDFPETSDEEVLACLERAVGALNVVDPPVEAAEVAITDGPVPLAGYLSTPPRPAGTVLVGHSGATGRHSARGRAFARRLAEAGLASLLIDLLTPAEELERALVFDIALLARRLEQATAWLGREVGTVPFGYFGAGTAAAAALWAASEPGTPAVAIVARAGRLDLAAARLAQVEAATLLIVEAHDTSSLELSRQGEAALHCETKLAIVPDPARAFGEPGAGREATELALTWFLSHLRHSAPSGRTP